MKRRRRKNLMATFTIKDVKNSVKTSKGSIPHTGRLNLPMFPTLKKKP